jgi:hypothetical protein
MQKNNITTGENFDSLITVLMNYDIHKDVLSETPHRRFLDLALVPVYLNGISDEKGIRLLTEKEYSHSSGNDEFLFKLGDQNYKRMMGLKVFSLNDFVKSTNNPLFEEDGPDILFEKELDDIYIITNKYFLFGARIMYDKDFMFKVGEFLKGDFYIIPSSVNEILVFSTKFAESIDYLKCIIKEVNESCLESTDLILSDNLYRYYCDKHEICIE